MQSGVRTVRQQGFGNLRGMSMRNVSERPKTSYLANAVSSGYSRNRNTVRHQARGIGRISAIAILVIEVFMIGLFYVSEQSKVTTYDYKMSAMDGSSGYSIFKQLMENYLQCSDFSIKNINNDIKINFANDPVKYLKQLGCFISDKSDYEVLWEKRAILKDDSYNIVFTFAYPLFIAKQYTRRF